ncbi:MAG: hypothetical protein ACLGH0_14200 [Thermoanaerobaculia bacterium]
MRNGSSGGKFMGTINQPTPSNPKSPQPDTQPLQPGGPKVSRGNSADPQRVNPQTPDSQSDKFRDR